MLFTGGVSFANKTHHVVPNSVGGLSEKIINAPNACDIALEGG